MRIGVLAPPGRLSPGESAEEAILDVGGMIPGASVLRLTRFGSATRWHPIDRVVREVMPTLLSQKGLMGAWFGRRTTAEGEERVVVSVWRSSEAEAAGVWVPASPELEDRIGAAERIVLPVAFDIRIPREVPSSVLRIYEGRTLPAQLDTYVEEAMEASRVDAARPAGPLAVCTALDRPDRFVTASVWADWAGLEACTGGDIRRPLLSRNTARLAGGRPTHYEIIASG